MYSKFEAHSPFPFGDMGHVYKRRDLVPLSRDCHAYVQVAYIQASKLIDPHSSIIRSLHE
jgi:hypothetical protein